MEEIKKEFKIRDKRDKGWFWINNEYLNGYAKIFYPTGTAIYISLCRHSDNETQKCFPSQDLIAEENGISISIVKEYIKLFEKCKIISATRKKNNKTKRWENIEYELISKQNWLSFEEAKKIIDKYRQEKRDRKSHSHTEAMDSHSHIEQKPQPHRTKSHSHSVAHNNTHVNNTHNNNTHIAEQAPRSDWQEIKQYYISVFDKEYNSNPEFGAKDGVLLSKLLKKYSPAELKALIDWYFDGTYKDRLGVSLSTILSNWVINKWISEKADKKIIEIGKKLSREKLNNL